MFKIGDRVLINASQTSLVTEEFSGVVDSVKECEWGDVDAQQYAIGVAVEDDGIYYRFSDDVRYDVDPMLIDKLLEL